MVSISYDYNETTNDPPDKDHQNDYQLFFPQTIFLYLFIQNDANNDTHVQNNLQNTSQFTLEINQLVSTRTEHNKYNRIRCIHEDENWISKLDNGFFVDVMRSTINIPMLYVL